MDALNVTTPRNDDAPGQGGVVGTAEKSTQRTNDTAKPPRKWQRILAAFVQGESLNRFEAERRYSDHCLHSTVSSIQARGVRIDRKDETVPGYMRIPTHVKRYWLATDQMQAALGLMGEV